MHEGRREVIEVRIWRRSIILVIASFTPYIIRPSLSEQRSGASPKIHHQHHH
ncbi:unnamed protein product [Prunus brigantina]